MKIGKLVTGLCVAGAMLAGGCGNSSRKVEPAIKTDKAIEAHVEKLLAKMTLDEKIGQMTQITLDVLGKGQSRFESFMPFELEPAMVDTIVNQYKVGSILNTATNTPFSVQAWENVVEQLQQAALKATGIPLIYGVDEIHGATYTIGATMFPQQVAMGATFNPNLVRRGAQIAAYEAKASNHAWSFSPVLDMGRDARWPRQWETYGEDTYLTSVLGKACVEGFQGVDPNHIGKDNIAACLKHYMGYGAPFSGKDRTPSYINNQDMRERHFEPFLQAIKTGALSVMVNSGVNNGLPVHVNKELLTGWLKEDLNWDGVIVTDWADINNLWSRDKIAADRKEAIMLAINAGIDMSMVPYEWSYCTYLKELVQEKKVSISRIDDAVRRVLRMKIRMGLFERPCWKTGEYPEFGASGHSAAALGAAQEAITLLKNSDNILPLKKSARILVAGPNANSMRTLNGGWTLSWQGEKTDRFAEEYNTILEALQHKVGKNNVVYEPGVTYNHAGQYWQENAPQISKAVSAAREADYIILCLGENSYCETPGNLDDLYLSENQQELAKALAATGKPVILVLNEGRPRVISKIEPLMKAVVQAYLPGSYGGDALADILYGDVNPSGKLPYTYPKYPNGTITYDHKPCEQLDKMEGAYSYDAAASVQWPFGFGLSYTRFEYSGLAVDKATFKANEKLTFTVKVKNTGKVAGKVAVMLFSSDELASLTPDVRRLRAFEKVELIPGEERSVRLVVNADDLAFVGSNGKWTLEEGYFTIQVGNLISRVQCTQGKIWTTPNR